jgi:hypothetical protein
LLKAEDQAVLVIIFLLTEQVVQEVQEALAA